MLKWTGRLALGVLLLLGVWIGGSLGYRAFRQHQNAALLIVETANGIDEATFVDIRGTDQWITIRGQDRANPIVLVVHGGPGSALSPLAVQFLPFEADFTVVQWDQHGAGKTFSRAGSIPAGMTIADVAADGIAVAEHVAAHLGQEKVILVGMSWGSIIGVEMVRTRPDLFHAFVGTGQGVHRDDGRAAAYVQLLDKARAQGAAEAVAALEAIGPPPHGPDAARVQREWRGVLSGDSGSPTQRVEQVLYAPRYSLLDVWSYAAGFMASDEHFDTGAVDLRTQDLQFDLPIFIIQGTEDYSTPTALARSYFDMISAPQKEFIPIEGGGHTALVDDAEAFVALLNAHVRPLAAPAN